MHLNKPLLLLCALLLCGHLRAQRADTLCCGCNHSFGWKQAAAPASLLAAGAAVSFTPLHTNWDLSIRDWSQRDGHQPCHIDNIVQYAPGAGVLLLKACGLESRHSWRDLVCLGAGASLVGLTVSTGMKYAFGVERPDGSACNSFPSGHTCTAFLGAEMLRREYGDEYPAVAVAGYAVAAGVGAMRVYNNRHWGSDVLAGAGIGILSASVMYWLAPYLRF